MLRYYFEIPGKEENKKIAAELKTEEKLSDKEFHECITEFAQDQGICPSWALSNCFYKIETITE